MRKLFLLTTFSVIAPIIVILNIIAISYLSYLREYQNPDQSARHQTVAFAALPPVQSIIQEEITQQDARVELVRQFFTRYRSPLEPYAEDVIKYAEAHDLDFRLIPAIAMQESNLCLKIPEGSNNCWGYGIYGGKVKRFDNYKEGIYEVTKALAAYKKGGLETPQQIMTRYTPGSNGAWARSVNYFMNQLQ